MNEILENLQNPVPVWLFLIIIFGFAGFNIKSIKRNNEVTEKEKSVFDQLYGEIRRPKEFEADFSKLANKEQKALKKLEYIRPFLNTRINDWWSFEQVQPKEAYSYFGMAGSHLLFQIYHGEKRVGEVGIELYPELYNDNFSYEVRIYLESYWLEAHEVRGFLATLSYLLHDDTEQRQDYRLQEINRTMNDAIWNKFTEKNMNSIQGVTNVTDDNLWASPLSLYFHGNLGVYF